MKRTQTMEAVRALVEAALASRHGCVASAEQIDAWVRACPVGTDRTALQLVNTFPPRWVRFERPLDGDWTPA